MLSGRKYCDTFVISMYNILYASNFSNRILKFNTSKRWNNEFLADPAASPNQAELHFGDLVQMIVVDVFETDCDGRLLSYCPTFDNRAISKTGVSVERLRKGSSKIKSQIKHVANSQAAVRVNRVSPRNW